MLVKVNKITRTLNKHQLFSQKYAPLQAFFVPAQCERAGNVNNRSESLEMAINIKNQRFIIRWLNGGP